MLDKKTTAVVTAIQSINWIIMHGKFLPDVNFCWIVETRVAWLLIQPSGMSHNITRAPIGAWKCNSDRPTCNLTEGQEGP